MSTLLLVILKIAFLALLWFFIFLVAQVIRTDMFGRVATAEDLAAVSGGEPAAAPRKRFGRKEQQTETPLPSKLEVTSGRAEGTWAPLPGDGTAILIGRSADASIDINDDYASSRHARVYSQDGEWIVEDLDSTNGTYVNGQQIQAPTIIGLEDTIRIGRTQLMLER